MTKEPVYYQALSTSVDVDTTTSIPTEAGNKGNNLKPMLTYAANTSADIRMNHRLLAEGDAAPACTATSAGAGITVGAVLGAAALYGAFALIGLSPLGPIAGGLFAANMGAELAAGGTMALVQSAAMTGTTYATGAAVGAAAGTGIACA